MDMAGPIVEVITNEDGIPEKAIINGKELNVEIIDAYPYYYLKVEDGDTVYRIAGGLYGYRVMLIGQKNVLAENLHEDIYIAENYEELGSFRHVRLVYRKRGEWRITKHDSVERGFPFDDIHYYTAEIRVDGKKITDEFNDNDNLWSKVMRDVIRMMG